jgi:hypothetical protein
MVLFRAVTEAQLSILIVNWNGRGMLRDLLQSIEQTRGNLIVQTIVVDNASTDGSPDMIAEQFPDVILHRNEQNAGFSKGNNQAAALATAPLLLLLNNDTILRDGALQTMVDFINHRPDVVAVGPKLIGVDGKPQSSARNVPSFAALLNSIQFLRWTGLFRSASRRFKQYDQDPDQPRPVQHLMAAAVLIRRDVFNQVGGFDEQYQFCPEDLDLCVRLADHGIIYYLPAAVIDHLGRISARANRDWAYAAEKRGWAIYVRKHHGPAAALIYKACVTLDAPLRLVSLSGRWICNWFRPDRQKFQRTSELLFASARFTLVGLPRFWKS